MRGRERFAARERLLARMEALVRRLPPGVIIRMMTLLRYRTGLVPRAFRYIALRVVAQRCGRLVDVRECVFLLAPEKLVIGSRVSIHPMCYIDCTGGVTIGDDVSIAHGVTIMSTEHSLEPGLPIRDNPVRTGPVRISDDVWIGAGARVLAGVSIGSRSVVAAGAVVTRDIPGGVIAAGVPARIMREL